jgi:hypothetical protein
MCQARHFLVLLNSSLTKTDKNPFSGIYMLVAFHLGEPDSNHNEYREINCILEGD